MWNDEIHVITISLERISFVDNKKTLPDDWKLPFCIEQIDENFGEKAGVWMRF